MNEKLLSSSAPVFHEALASRDRCPVSGAFCDCSYVCALLEARRLPVVREEAA